MITKKLIEDNLHTINRKLADMSSIYEFKHVSTLKEKTLNNALKKIAPGCRYSDIIALWDTTIFNSGKDGFLLAANGLYGKDFPFSSPDKRGHLVPFKNLAEVDYAPRMGYGNLSDNYLAAEYKNGSCQVFYCGIYNHAIRMVLRELLALSAAEEAAKPAKKSEPAPNPTVRQTPAPDPVRAAPAPANSSQTYPLPPGGLPEHIKDILEIHIAPDFWNCILPYDSHSRRALQCKNPEAARRKYTAFYEEFSRCRAQGTVGENISDLADLLVEAITEELPAAFGAMACLLMGYSNHSNEELVVAALGPALQAGILSSSLVAGYCYRYGLHVKQNPKQAYAQLFLAASGGLGDAHLQIAQMEYFNQGLRNTPESVWEHFCKAAELGCFRAALPLFFLKDEEWSPDVDWNKCAQALEQYVDTLPVDASEHMRDVAAIAAYYLMGHYSMLPGEEAVHKSLLYSCKWLGINTDDDEEEPTVQVATPPAPVHRSIDEFVESDSTPEQKESYLSSMSRNYLRELPGPRYIDQFVPESELPEEFQNNPGSSVYAAALDLLKNDLTEEKMGIVVRLLESAAQLGSLTAQNALAALYLPIDEDALTEKGFRLADAAASDGHPLAALNAGWCYEHGLVTHTDMDMATLCYLMASRRGVGEASMYLARCYAFGNFVEKDERLAWQFIRLAADQGEQAAALLVGRVLAKGKNPGVDINQVMPALLSIVDRDKIGAPVIDPEVSNTVQALKYLLAITVDTERWRNLELGQMIADLTADYAPALSAEYAARIANFM